MHRLRMYLAAGATLAVLATSGLTFAQGTAGGSQGQTQGSIGVRAHSERWKPGSGDFQHGPVPGNNGFYRANHGPDAFRPVPGDRSHGPRLPFAPWPRPYVPGPGATCYALTTVSGTVSAIYGSNLTIVAAYGRTLTLPLAVNAVVTEGGVAVPPSALAPGEAVTVTVTCQGLASSVNITG